ncbi:MAG TPA: hypothetical protein VH164_06970, partial [Ktedonobacteraceae bacterium]|nr:hypothetical protein [Ktedonobacteraceae bacterium]
APEQYGKHVRSYINHTGSVQVWNALDGSPITTHNNHSGQIQSSNWSPDGEWIASGGTDNMIHVWRAM